MIQVTRKSRPVKPKMINVRVDLMTEKLDVKKGTTLKEFSAAVTAAIAQYGEDTKVSGSSMVAVIHKRPETEKERERRLKLEAAEAARKAKRKASKLKHDQRELEKLAKRLNVQIVHPPVKAPNYTE